MPKPKKRPLAAKHRTPHQNGRPRLLTPALERKILGLVRRGLYLETVAVSVGISRGALFHWLSRGREEAHRVALGAEPNPAEAPFLEFLNAVQIAQAEGEVHNFKIVEKAAKTDWQAAWKLLTHGPGRARWGSRSYETEPPPMPVPTMAVSPEVSAAATEAPHREVDVVRSLLFSDAGRDLLDRATALVASRSERNGGVSVRGAIPATTPRTGDLEGDPEGLHDAGEPDDDHDPPASR